jgi:glucose-1-phosphate thymidylyltransferase
LEAGEFIRTIEHRQGLKVACLEEIAYGNNWISEAEVVSIAHSMRNTQYGQYLIDLVAKS